MGGEPGLSWLRLPAESRSGTAAAASRLRLGQGEDLLPAVGRGARRERKWRKGGLGTAGGDQRGLGLRVIGTKGCKTTGL